MCFSIIKDEAITLTMDSLILVSVQNKGDHSLTGDHSGALYLKTASGFLSTCDVYLT